VYILKVIAKLKGCHFFEPPCKICYSHIRELRYIRPYLDSKTASTIAACIVHSKLDYCNCIYFLSLNGELCIRI